MSRTDLPRWSLALALLVAPTALRAQNPTLPDSGAKSSTTKPQDSAATEQVICKDGTAGVGAQGCANHGGVDAFTTNASRTGRVDIHPPDSGGADQTMNPSGHTGTSRDTGVRIKPDTSQLDGWNSQPDGWNTTPRAPTDFDAPADSTL